MGDVEAAITHDAVEFWSRIGYDDSFRGSREFTANEKGFIEEELSDEAIDYYYDEGPVFPRKSFEIAREGLNAAALKGNKENFVEIVLQLYRKALNGKAVFSDETENLLLRDTFLFSKGEEVIAKSEDIAKIVPTLVPESERAAVADAYNLKLREYAAELARTFPRDELRADAVKRVAIAAEPPTPPPPTPEPGEVEKLKEQIEKLEGKVEDLGDLIDGFAAPLNTFIALLVKKPEFKTSTQRLKQALQKTIDTKNGILAE